MRITFEADERPALLTKLGLEDKATDEDITTAFTEWANDDTPVTPEQTPEQVAAAAAAAAQRTPEQIEADRVAAAEAARQQQPPEEGDTDDVVVLDISAFQSLQGRAQRTEHLEEEKRVSDRTTLIEGAIKDGKFGKSRKEHYEARFDSDAEDTVRIIGMMRKGVIPTDERGTDADPDEIASDAYPPDWLPEVSAQQIVEPNNNGNGATATVRRNRVQSEE